VRDESDIDHHDALLGAVAAGDVRALERLYRELRVGVFALALSVVRDRSVAEDVLHDTFVRVYERAHTYRPGKAPRLGAGNRAKPGDRRGSAACP
jgi:DNA-directed RNA polymerase specialized sigma24 family protein